MNGLFTEFDYIMSYLETNVQWTGDRFTQTQVEHRTANGCRGRASISAQLRGCLCIDRRGAPSLVSCGANRALPPVGS